MAKFIVQDLTNFGWLTGSKSPATGEPLSSKVSTYAKRYDTVENADILRWYENDINYRVEMLPEVAKVDVVQNTLF